jgi:hypothetical protein
MKKILSFSLYGNKKIYNFGCIENAKLHKTFFTDWEMRVYYNSSVPEETIKELKSLDVNLIKMEDETNYFCSLWRFFAINDIDYTHFISRDCDSRISLRDECAVNQWLDSGKEYHIIRDHPIGHGWEINAGMWGAKTHSNFDIQQLIKDYIQINNLPNEKSIDQMFLRDVIHPKAKQSLYLNDTFFNHEGCGVAIDRDRKLDDFAFIGEPFDEENKINPGYREDIKSRF